MTSTDYPSWPKTPRLSKRVAIMEKIDGTNGLISIEKVPFGSTAAYSVPADGIFPVMNFSDPLGPDGLPTTEYVVRAGSRNRWLTPDDDNYGFAKWVDDNAVELTKLGPGNHYGEWFGQGIQRNYGLTEKRFALFNVARWKAADDGWSVEGYPYEKAVVVPEVPGLTAVPLLMVADGDLLSQAVTVSLGALERNGSAAVRGFGRPEGVIAFHEGSRSYYKAFTEFGGK